MSVQFPYLMSSGRIGPMALANRIVLPAMDMNVSEHGEIEQTEIDHYVARAAGGAGLVITGACAIAFPHGAASMKEPGLSDDRYIPGLKALADAIHAAGSKLCIQSTHHGKVARVDVANDRPVLAPNQPDYSYDLSALADSTPSELARMGAATAGKPTVYQEMTHDDIAWLVTTWADAAERVAKAGADAIEIHVAHGYILGVFLNRRDNQRTDEYGGPLVNRARLACEVIAAVKERVGDRLAVLVRVAGEEYGQDGGLSLPESIEAAELFEAAGADAIHVTGWGRNPFDNFTDGPLPARVGAYLDNAAEIKKHVGIPVIAVGRMLPEVAEKAIAKGRIDYAAMGRQLLADPELPNKLRDGRFDEVRPCINCYLCVAENFFDDTPFCAVNPALGNEGLLPLEPAAEPKHVVVVGAGPAGLESARVLSERGHRVTVVDKADRLGGTMWFSTMTTPDNERLLRWLRSEVERLGITVQLGTPATVETIRALRADHVVVATGAVRPKPELPGGDLPIVQTGDTLRALMLGTATAEEAGPVLRTLGKLGRVSGLTKRPGVVRQLTKAFLPMGKDVVVIGGSLVGLELAEFLAERGRRVTLLHEQQQLGLPLAMPRRWTAVRHATEHGVQIHRNVSITRITETGVEWTEGDQTHSAPADMVVYADGTTSAAPLADELRAAGFSVDVVGDAGEVNYIHGAIHSSWKAATTV
ncbi:FAD-dependent oxidoreductase [Nocardioides sp. zg-579]|uniref:FAD-dependent oxidoreductase n=1 Tax=Nocardioides marmotae TaxID=2663857 RepID=A0A6I3IUY8_9ACTN|nr:NAD(P)/FAD-dependent oxidoreductase [Nocardioides marmotae]MCR6030627.1 FAD-dependent oxidoreductase [Gordonia jinghuaiqii]MTB94263.1 FAD-dependent oxidoreductase [Nocardioides marmotae]QKE00540.1 FAD-dependent oxidoreductase [Nocardioides marmotae]